MTLKTKFDVNRREIMKPVTWDDVIQWKPCCSEEELAELQERHPGPMDAHGILGLRGEIPDADLIWLLCHEELLPATTVRLFAADCAERALVRQRKAGREPDQRSWEAVASVGIASF